MGVSTAWIPAAEPFDGGSVLGFLEARAVAGLEEVKGGSYRRSVSLKNGGGHISVRPECSGVRVELDLDDTADADEALERVGRLFDVDADPTAIEAVLGADRLLAPLVARRRGLRVPGAMDGFELAVRAIVGQQVSVAGARTVLGRLVREHGGLPSDVLAEADPGGFPFPRARGAALVEVAGLVAAGELRLEPDADADEARARLLAIPGIGPWTVVVHRHARARRSRCVPPRRRGRPARRWPPLEAIPIRTAGGPGAPTRSCISGTPEIRSRAMRAVQITELTGPESALQEVDLPEPEPSHPLTPGSGVVIDVHAAGVSFPEVLQTRGEYQIKPDLPFVPGSEVAGVVRSAPEGSGLAEGDRVAGCCLLGAWAEVAVAPDFLTFKLSDELDFAQGAGLILNYHTAYFSPEAPRPARGGRDRARSRRGRRRRHRHAPGGEGARRAHDRGRVERRQGADRARGGRRRGGALRRRLEGRGEGAVGRRRGHRASTPWAATASPTACGRCARTGGSWWWASPAARSPR